MFSLLSSSTSTPASWDDGGGDGDDGGGDGDDGGDDGDDGGDDGDGDGDGDVIFLDQHPGLLR